MTVPTAKDAKRQIRKLGNPKRAAVSARFFKTAPGEYGEGDKFLGIPVPTVRSLAKDFRNLPLAEIKNLISSPWHEERLLALILLSNKAKANEADHEELANFYLKHKKWVNNWDLVDTSAEHVLGRYFFARSRAPLFKLIKSSSLWDRRIGFLSTFHFIRKNDFKDTLVMAKHLIKDKEDLIHKATGWLLREVGKRDLVSLLKFLNNHAHKMPRTMLRYSLEKLPLKKRAFYMAKKKRIRNAL